VRENQSGESNPHIYKRSLAADHTSYTPPKGMEKPSDLKLNWENAGEDGEALQPSWFLRDKREVIWMGGKILRRHEKGKKWRREGHGDCKIRTPL